MIFVPDDALKSMSCVYTDNKGRACSRRAIWLVSFDVDCESEDHTHEMNVILCPTHLAGGLESAGVDSFEVYKIHDDPLIHAGDPPDSEDVSWDAT